LRVLQFLNRCAAFFVEAQKAIQRRARVVEAAIGQAFEEGILIVADPFDVEHGSGFSASAIHVSRLYTPPGGQSEAPPQDQNPCWVSLPYKVVRVRLEARISLPSPD
jgi:hypothetical protein